jgi:hypothetical protein
MENELMHPFMNDLDDLRVDQNLPILTNILKDICNTVEVTNIQNREYFFPTCDGNPTELCVWWEVPIYYNDEFTDRYEHSIVWPESIDHTRYMESFGAMLEIMREKGFLQ